MMEFSVNMFLVCAQATTHSLPEGEFEHNIIKFRSILLTEVPDSRGDIMMKKRLKVLLPFVLLCLFACSDDPYELKEGQSVTFTLLQTTDVHHHVAGTGPSSLYGDESFDTTLGGYSRLATAINEIRTENTAREIPTIVVDSGDYFMGTVYDLSLGQSPAALSFISAMDYDAVTIGNHELDYGPGALSGFFNLAVARGFDVPVVVSNMVTDDTDDADDGLAALFDDGVFEESLMLTLSNGLKVGIIGLLGKSAESDAAMKSPLTFVNDMNDDEEIAWIQSRIDVLKAEGAHVVIALSHSGITDPDGSPSGDDMALADAVTGIDIIASGHNHEVTGDVVTENGTRIICAGRYGENLAQLDVTVVIGSGVDVATLSNHTMDSSVALSDTIESYLVAPLETAINTFLTGAGLPEIHQIVATTDSDNMSIPASAGETGMGNLAADSVRYVAGGSAISLGLVANGVIRNGYDENQSISFSDLYNTLPLGMTPDTANQTSPGYPLLLVYMDAASITSLCNLAALTIAASDETFMGYLYSVDNEAYQTLLNFKSDYYLNISGLRFTYGSDYSVDTSSIALYDPTDYPCQGVASTQLTSIGGAYIPCVLDLYMAMMFLDTTLQRLLSNAGLSITPYLDGSGSDAMILSSENVMDARIDMDSTTDGVQEIKEWMALLDYVTDTTTGLASTIPDSFYGSTAIEIGNASRVNAPGR